MARDHGSYYNGDRGVNRKDFQDLADVRIAEAELLLKGGCFDGAYYLAGYAVECALKACIAKLTKDHDFPPPRKVVEDCYTHNIETLVKAAGLDIERRDAINNDTDLGENWSIVKDWTEASRYNRQSEEDARKLFEAITNTASGVLPWIKARW